MAAMADETAPRPSAASKSAARQPVVRQPVDPAFAQPSPPISGNRTIAVLRMLAYLGWILVLLPVQLVAVNFDWRLKRRLPKFFHRVSRFILGIEVVTVGTPVAQHPALIVANHAGYLDIPVLGSLMEAVFVAKAEIRGWPVFGWLARLQGCSFIDRSRSATANERDSLAKRLDDGEVMILFPEGTSSDGNRTLNFKSALLAIAAAEPDGRPLAVQPVSIAYTRLDGIPLGRAFRPFFAWYGDMEMASHLWQMLGLGVVTVEVRFHEPVTLKQLGSRKALAAYCQTMVAGGVSGALAGRPFGGPQLPAPPEAETKAEISAP